MISYHTDIVQILSSAPTVSSVRLVSSYLHPGGDREWKVERENISALSAIFFYKWLRVTAENHGLSAVHSQSQSRQWTVFPHSLLSLRLGPRPRRCRLAASLLSDESSQDHQICSHNHPKEQVWEGSWWGGLAELPSETVRNAAAYEIATLPPPDASKRSTKARCPRSDQMVAAVVMLPVALTGSRRAGRPAVRRQAETGGGKEEEEEEEMRRGDGVTSVMFPYQAGLSGYGARRALPGFPILYLIQFSYIYTSVKFECHIYLVTRSHNNME